MTVTLDYSRAWRAFRNVGADNGIGGFDVRMLVALYEDGGPWMSEIDLARWLRAKREAVKRSGMKLADGNLVVRSQVGHNGKATLCLMPGGANIARAAYDAIGDGL